MIPGTSDNDPETGNKRWIRSQYNSDKTSSWFWTAFITSCESDERVVAAFIGGSYVRGQADTYSDLDLYLITTDGKYEDVPGRARGICSSTRQATIPGRLWGALRPFLHIF